MFRLLPVIICFFILFLGFISCRDSIHSEKLIAAETLADQDPDSARIVLNQIDSASLNSKDERMLLRLLKLEVADKLYETHRDDSEIKTLLDYFIEGDHLQRVHPLVYYYSGRVYYDLHEDAKALGYYKKALKTVKISGNPRLESLIHTQMCYLYFDHRLYDHSSRHIRESIKISLQLNDTLNIIQDALTLADQYISRNETDSAIHIYHHLEPFVAASHDSITNTQFYTQLAAYYYYYDDPKKADSIIKNVPIVYNDQTRTSVLCVIDKIRQGYEKKDPDEHLYLSLIKDADPGIRFRAAKNLAKVSAERHDWEKMIEYLDLAMTNLKAVQNKFNTNSIVEMEKIIDEADLENENLRLSVVNHHRFLIIILCIVLIMIAAATSVILFIRGRLRKTAYALEIEKMNAENRRVMVELEEEIGRLRTDDRAAAEAERLQWNLQLARLQERLTTMLIEGDEPPTEEDFVELRNAFSRVKPEFIDALDGMGLRQKDYQDALLIRINVPQKVCASFFGVTPQAVANSRRRLWKKFASDSQTKNWKEYIDSL